MVRAQAAELQFLTHSLPPLNFSKDGEAVGLSVDIVQELQRRTETKAPVTMLPWARAYAMATSTPNVALFFVTKTAERERLFQWVGPIANVDAAFFAKSGSALKIEHLEDARRVKMIVVHRGSHLEQSLRQLGFTNLQAVNLPEDAIRMLLMQEDGDALLLLTTVSIPSSLSKLGVAADAIKPVLVARKGQAYIAFSEGTAAEIPKKFQKSLDEMKRDGSFATLYSRWLPREKPPGIKPDADFDLLH